MTFTRTLLAVLATAAIVAPAAIAQPMRDTAPGLAAARSLAAPPVDLRSPDARDAAAAARSATVLPVNAPPTWPRDPQPIRSSVASSRGSGGGGIDVAGLALGSALAVAALAGLAALERRRRHPHVTA